MKHRSEQISPSLLLRVAQEAGVSVSGPVADRLTAHAKMMLDANAVMNLTRITEPEQVVRLHIIDSIAWLDRTEPLRGSVVDIGSGAGFPGIAIEIATGTPVLLCESVAKKAAFLKTVQEELGLLGDVYVGRAEDLANEHRGEFQTVTARALSSMPSLLELAAPLLAPGGRLIAMKAKPDRSEIEQANRAARICGMSEPVGIPYSLGASDVNRSILISARVSAPEVDLPRRSGLAQRRPLG